MASPRPFELELLAPAARILSRAARETPAALQQDIQLRVLEKASSLLGGYDYEWYCSTANVSPLPRLLHTHAQQVLDAIPHNVPPPLALSTLAAPTLDFSARRRGGAYYTDFRLAKFLVERIGTPKSLPRIIDPASGTGILLVAAAMQLCRNGSFSPTKVVGQALHGADLSRDALRGAALAAASLTSSRKAIAALLTHLRQGDSLQLGDRMWADVAPEGFDVVIGNPPWEKLKLSAHEFLRSKGKERHYGADTNEDEIGDLPAARQAVKMYVRRLEEEYALQGNGDPDAYKLFLELAAKLVRADGNVHLLVPAGLIRSQGAASLRSFLFNKSSRLEFTLFDNKARYFSIDTRFKFLALSAWFGAKRHEDLAMQYADAEDVQVAVRRQVGIPRHQLARIRPDLTVPEVRSSREWRLFARLAEEHAAFGSSAAGWNPRFMREVDMSKDRAHFRRQPGRGMLPLIEGRMVHQFRHDMKRYVSGTGRRAVWEVHSALGQCEVKPQFWYPERQLSERVRERINQARVGFCDITGQTNERSMLASIIPANMVCGNKVPTILFDVDTPKEAQDAWVAIANSFVFDWMLRRLITTTVNYFILESVPIPKWTLTDINLQRIASLSRRATSCGHTNAEGPPSRGVLRGRLELEWRIALLYGLEYEDLALILQDFPLIDRGQPALPGERRSTVTRDNVLLAASAYLEGVSDVEREHLVGRVQGARDRGAIPFVPSEAAE